MGLKILVVGAGICGPALASLLLRARQNHKITVIERSKEIRVGGAQIDLKNQAVPILERMGLLESVKKVAVQETGLEIVDSQGRTLMQLDVSPANKRLLTLTSEYEIMRGDLVRLLHDDSMSQARAHDQDGEYNGSLSYRFDTTISSLHQRTNGVQVEFSDGTTENFDLVVAADGQRSATRRLAFGSAISEEAVKLLGIDAAYFSIPREKYEGGLARLCLEPGIALLTRTSGRPVTGLNIFTTIRHEAIQKSYSQPIASQKALWADLLANTHWQRERFEDGLQSCADFYAHEQAQVKTPTLSVGRVVLLGDAGFCPSPFTGLGTTLALGGAYVLAGELAGHVGDVDQALREYESKMKPLVDECQQLWPGGPKAIIPTSAVSVRVVEAFIWTMSILRIDRLVSKWIETRAKEDSGRQFHEYPELKFATRTV